MGVYVRMSIQVLNYAQNSHGLSHASTLGAAAKILLLAISSPCKNASRNFKSWQKCFSRDLPRKILILADSPAGGRILADSPAGVFSLYVYVSIQVPIQVPIQVHIQIFVMPPGRTMDLAPGIVEYNLYSFEYNYIHLSIKFMDLAMMVLADGVPWIML